MQNSSSSSSARREGDRDVAMDISESCRVLSCMGEINCELLGGGGGNGVVWFGSVLDGFNVGVVMCGAVRLECLFWLVE